MIIIKIHTLNPSIVFGYRYSLRIIHGRRCESLLFKGLFTLTLRLQKRLSEMRDAKKEFEINLSNYFPLGVGHNREEIQEFFLIKLFTSNSIIFNAFIEKLTFHWYSWNVLGIDEKGFFRRYGKNKRYVLRAKRNTYLYC